jgi:hypothetical protein
MTGGIGAKLTGSFTAVTRFKPDQQTYSNYSLGIVCKPSLC